MSHDYPTANKKREQCSDGIELEETQKKKIDVLPTTKIGSFIQVILICGDGGQALSVKTLCSLEMLKICYEACTFHSWGEDKRRYPRYYRALL